MFEAKTLELQLAVYSVVDCTAQCWLCAVCTIMNNILKTDKRPMYHAALAKMSIPPKSVELTSDDVKIDLVDPVRRQSVRTAVVTFLRNRFFTHYIKPLGVLVRDCVSERESAQHDNNTLLVSLPRKTAHPLRRTSELRLILTTIALPPPKKTAMFFNERFAAAQYEERC